MNVIGLFATSIAENPEIALFFNTARDLFLVDLKSEQKFLSPGMKKIGVAKNVDTPLLITEAAKNQFYHILQTSNSGFLREIAISDKLLYNPDQIISAMPFEILAPGAQNNEIHIHFNSTKDKSDVFDKVDKFVNQVPGSNAIGNAAHLIADEMFTNALYNAPNALKTDDLNSHSRKRYQMIDPSEPAILTLAYDKDHIVISCQDPFGSLNETKFFQSLLSAYSKDAKIEVKFGSGGAGIGTRLLIDNSVEFYVICKKNEKTVFSCVLPLHVGSKKIDLTFKNIHITFY